MMKSKDTDKDAKRTIADVEKTLKSILSRLDETPNCDIAALRIDQAIHALPREAKKNDL